MSKTPQAISSDELADLMDRVQQLLEADVIAMVLRHPTGGVSITCPPHRRDEVVAYLRSVNWKTWQPQ